MNVDGESAAATTSATAAGEDEAMCYRVRISRPLERAWAWKDQPASLASGELSIPLAQLHGHGHPCHCERLISLADDLRVVLTAETNEFRRLIRAHTTTADRVVEIGSSFGEATKLLARECPSVLGLELSADAVAESRRRHPHIRFERCDALAEPER